VAKNPYQVLGVAPSATDADIRAAFRKLAKQYHPDRNPGDKAAEERFKEVSSAFDVLGDASRRKRFDAGEIDADGRERAQYRQWQGGPYRPGAEGFGPGAGAGGANFDDLGDIFADLFGASRGYRDRTGQRGRDLRYRLEIDLLDAVNGGAKRVTMPDARELDITIPAGVADGQTLRLKGQGEKAPAGGIAGDIYVELKIKPHPVFRREGGDIHIEAPITLKEAVLGGKITVPTIAGDVALTVPRNTSSGAILRLKGRGAVKGKGVRGDQFVKLRIVLPEGGDAELEEFVRRWKGGESEPRRKSFAGA
jgi:DnaJ-class molecular chaperone